MPRRLLILAAMIVAVLPAEAADAKKVTLRWHGQSFFTLESSTGTRVAFDPHAIDSYGRIVVRADLVLISHFHNDHTQIGSIENKEKAKVLAGLKTAGKRVEWNPVDEKFRDVSVRSIGTYHDNLQGMERGLNSVFIVEMDGMRFVHLGDLGHPLSEAQVKEIGPVDVLMIPVGGVYTINGSEAKAVVKQLKPKKFIFPMHYGTPVFDDLLPATEFLEEQNPKYVKVQKASNRFDIISDLKPPEPIIVILGWGR